MLHFLKGLALQDLSKKTFYGFLNRTIKTNTFLEIDGFACYKYCMNAFTTFRWWVVKQNDHIKATC